LGDHELLEGEIAARYAEVPERERLGPLRLERVRTWELLGRHLPPAPAVVLDVGVDAVLLLGPLYHLTARADRLRALAEARRVLRPDGVLAAAAISRFASTCDGLLRGYLDEPGFEAIVEGDLRDGQHRNPTGRPEWFTTAYFHLPDELALEVAEAGLRLQALVAVEGPAWMLPDIERRLADPDRREVVLRAIRRIETEPSLLGASAHLLAVARR
jgi:SAM-dependent methyltransferase